MSKKQSKKKSKYKSQFQAYQLKVGSLYCFVSSYSLCLFKSQEEAFMYDYEEVCGTLGPKEPFLVVETVPLLKDKPCSEKKFIIKVIAGDKMGWTNILENRHRFKAFDEEMAAEYEELRLGWKDGYDSAAIYAKPFGKNVTWTLNK